MSLFFEVQNGPFPGLPRKRLEQRVLDVCKSLKLQKKELSLVLTTDAHIHQLNREYRKKNKPTDVLAFATQEGEFAHLTPNALGDVVISVETAKRQAAEHRRALIEETTMLAVHGILHLLGWDHDTDATEAAMNTETARLCALAQRAEQARRELGSSDSASDSKPAPGAPPARKKVRASAESAPVTTKSRQKR